MEYKRAVVSQKEFDRILNHYLQQRLKSVPPKASINTLTGSTFNPTSSGNRWNMYAYGDLVKIVYIKHGHKQKKPSKVSGVPSADGERFRQSIARSKAKIFELAMCNEFQHFCTFTQDQTKRERFDLVAFRKDFTMLIRNLNRNRDEGHKIKYILIPEQHRDGAWHMHGLFQGLTDKDLRPFELNERLPKHILTSLEKGDAVYDWTAYRRRFGYFTATEIKSKDKCAKYITKYISKDFQSGVREQGCHLFFASQGLKRREVIIKDELGVCPYVDTWDYENDYIKVAEIKL